jgi:hypothetical protein
MTRNEEFEKKFRDAFYDKGMPPHMYDGLKNYLLDGIEPGSFLMGVLTNDFVKATCCADLANVKQLPDWARFVYNDIPSIAWGSKDFVHAWISKGGYRGLYPEE